MEHNPAPLDLTEEEEREIARIKGGVFEMEEAEQPTPKSRESQDVGGVPGINLIQSLITASFFHDLFCKSAYARYTHANSEDRVAAMIARHRGFYRLCRYSDYAYRFFAAAVVLSALTAIVAGSILRIFFPHVLPE